MKKARIAALIVISLSTFSAATPAQANQKSKCLKKQQQLEQTQAKLRQGYSEPQGNKLRAKRRKLQDYVSSKKCRRYT